MINRFSPMQKRVTLGCVLAYTAAYIARLNLSAALSAIMEAMSITQSQAGLLHTAFASFYAAGQLLNGMIVDKVRPRVYLALGLLGTALCNLLLGLSGRYEMLIVLCCLNGLFQSMLWTPIVRLMAGWFGKGEERAKVSFYVSLTLVIGHFLAWAVSGAMSQWVGWRGSFLVPSAAAAFCSVLTFIIIPDSSIRTSPAIKTGASVKTVKAMPIRALLFRTGLPILLLACIAYGFTRDGIVTWTPDIINHSNGKNTLSSVGVSLIIPVINTAGILLGHLILKNKRINPRTVIAVMTLSSAVASFVLCTVSGIFTTALFMGLGCAFLFGLNPMLTSLVPMEFDLAKRVGLVAGLVDSFIYVGSALSGFLTGLIYQQSGHTAVYIVWVTGSLFAALCMFLFARNHSLDHQEQAVHEKQP